jgi:uncharacterized protein (TIGR03437 family)
MTLPKLCLCLSGFLLAATAPAAPTLRVNAANLRPIWVQQGTNGPANAFFEIYNIGDGSLSPQVKGSYSWLTPALDTAKPCTFNPGQNCIPVKVLLSAANLAAGAYSGVITVSDSGGALDAPQTVAVTIYVNGNVPPRLDFYAPPSAGASDSASFQTPAGPAPMLKVNTASGGNWLAVSSSGMGSFQFLYTHQVQATVQAGMAAGDYTGSVTVSNSTFAADNRPVPVTLHVTAQPIARPAVQQLQLRAVQGAGAVQQVVAVANAGLGVLTLSGAAAAGGAWLTASVQPGGGVQVSADPGSLAAGFYTGTVTISSNAANTPVIPVQFEVQAPSAPLANFGGVVDAAAFTAPVGSGALVSLFGSQLAGGVAQAGSIPLPTTLSGATVFVNDAPAPLIFVSPAQINFQMPYEVSGTARVRVERAGQRGNTITVQVARRGPGLYGFPGTSYGIVVNASRGNGAVVFAVPDTPAFAGIPKAAARAGDVLVLYGSGLGPVSPAPATGAAAGSDPLSQLSDKMQVNFSTGAFAPFVDPQFVGLTPGFVGLFQVNVQVPPGLPASTHAPLQLVFPDGTASNVVEFDLENQ